ncbi:MAG: hypothetical protein J6W23_02210, partial [Victivallales bacterium]|nr:hypothetical protein [Victivallales bacterium]
MRAACFLSFLMHLFFFWVLVLVYYFFSSFSKVDINVISSITSSNIDDKTAFSNKFTTFLVVLYGKSVSSILRRWVQASFDGFAKRIFSPAAL